MYMPSCKMQINQIVTFMQIININEKSSKGSQSWFYKIPNFHKTTITQDLFLYKNEYRRSNQFSLFKCFIQIKHFILKQ